MAEHPKIIPPRIPFGTVDGKPVIINREWFYWLLKFVGMFNDAEILAAFAGAEAAGLFGELSKEITDVHMITVFPPAPAPNERRDVQDSRLLDVPVPRSTVKPKDIEDIRLLDVQARLSELKKQIGNLEVTIAASIRPPLKGGVATVSSIADNAVVRGDGGTNGIQGSLVILDDNANITAVSTLTASGRIATPLNVSSGTVSTASVYAPTLVSTTAVSTDTLRAVTNVSSATVSTATVFATDVIGATRVSTATVSTASVYAPTLVSTVAISTNTLRAVTNVTSATVSTATVYATDVIGATRVSTATVSSASVYAATAMSTVTFNASNAGIGANVSSATISTATVFATDVIGATRVSTATVSSAAVYAATSMSTVTLSVSNVGVGANVSSATVSTATVYATDVIGATRVSTATVSSASVYAATSASTVTLSASTVAVGANVSSATVSTSVVTTDTIVSASTTAVVFNTIATTVNAFQAATSLRFGTAGRTSAWGGAPVNFYRDYFLGAFTSGGGSTFASMLRVEGQLTGAAGDTTGLAISSLGNLSIVTQGNSDTIGFVATFSLGEPNITVGTGDTITAACTLYIANAPTEGTGNYSLFIDAGLPRIDSSTAAGAGVGTITNTPNAAGGNPAIYLLLNIAGTSYAFPGWAL